MQSFIKENLNANLKMDLITRFLRGIRLKSSSSFALFTVMFLSFMIRVLMGTGGVSGDYEVHRHWMSITLNLPSTDWYYRTPFNEDKHHLDYPPLMAYYELCLGWICSLYNPHLV